MLLHYSFSTHLYVANIPKFVAQQYGALGEDLNEKQLVQETFGAKLLNEKKYGMGKRARNKIDGRSCTKLW